MNGICFMGFRSLLFISVDIFACGNGRADMSGMCVVRDRGAEADVMDSLFIKNDMAPPMSYLLCCSSCLPHMPAVLTDFKGQSGQKCLCFISTPMTSLFGTHSTLLSTFSYIARGPQQST